MVDQPRKRGRPRAFDEAEALAAASRAFLRHGYAGTSLEILSHDTKLAKPSLYAAFGDKHALFMAVLKERIRMVTSRYTPAFERGRTLEESLRNTFEECVEICLGVDGGPPGCPVAAAQTTEALVDEDVRELTKTFRSQIDRGMARWIQKRLPPNRASLAEPIARMTNGILHDIALRARVGESRTKLRELSRDAAKLLVNACGIEDLEK